MKRFEWILLVLTVAPTMLSADTRKMTVAQFQDVLTGLHNSQKSDEQIANELKQIELTEELTTTTMNSMVNLVKGPLSTEQIYVLEARSAMLAPPDTDLPKAAPPEAAAQQALLAKAQEYTAKTYQQLARLTATRLVARFQDGVEAIQSYGGANTKTVNDDDPIWQQNHQYVRLANTHTDTVEIDNGIEKPGGKDTTPWGRNGLVNSMLPFLPLSLVTTEAISSGSPKFLRWETIAGHQAAVFTFAVDKKKSHYALNYCCFPDTSSVGNALYGPPPKGGGSSPSSAGSLSISPLAHPLGNNVANVSDWKPFNSKSGYHGELFLDADSGVILRTIVEAEFKPSDFVHYEDIRVDYAPMPIGGNNLYVPVRSFTIAEIVPNGDSFAAHYAVRHQFVTGDYKEYQLAGAMPSAVSARKEDAKPQIEYGQKKVLKEINADVLAARDADREKRYADAEALMLKNTRAKPDLILPWVELGLAQIGLKKYADAEISFNTALAIAPNTPKTQHDIGYYQPNHPQTTVAASAVTSAPDQIANQARTPEINGVIYSSLGEIYIRTNRVPQAEEAFDTAAKANPTQAAFYLRNETVFFFQTGNTEGQLRAAEKAIAVDPNGAMPYYFKGLALASKATVDQAGKPILPPGCAEAYQKYLQLDANGQFAADAKNFLAAAGIPSKSGKS